MLRAGPALHGALRAGARTAGVSLNDYCIARLSAPAAQDPHGAAPSLLGWARRGFGDALVGLAIYGSWARGEATAESDVDLLVVLDGSQPLRRELYRRCDEADLMWDGHPLQPQVVHLPATNTVGGGLWPEIALDGIVLYERDFLVSRHLVRVRRAIADGRLVRRTAHGQPYWTTVEAA